MGKVTLVNAYCVGKLAYAAPFLTITSAKINKLVGDYWNAIWSRKAFRLNQGDAAADREEGGMGGLQLRLWLQSHLAVWVPWATQGKKWSDMWNAVARRFKPSKRGNLVQRATFYWRKFGLKYEDVEEGPWKARDVYERIKLRPILKSCINQEFQWGKIRASILRGKVQEVWWRWHHDRLKIQRVEGSRPFCNKCNKVLNSNHLVNECLRNEALSKLKEIGLEMEEEHWDMETINGPVQWLTILIKFNIWKVYASHVYGQGKVNPDWFK